VKWFLIGSACLFCSTTCVWGDAAELYNQGNAAMGNQQYDVAAQAYDAIVSGYPTFTYIDDVRLQLGQAYLYSGKYPEAIDRLAKEINSKTHPEYMSQALYYTALAQFSQGQKASDKNSFTQAVTTLTTLVDMLTKAPSSETISMLESALYYRALSYYERDDYADAEKDLVKLTTTPDFANSLVRPDYLLRLGNVYQIETNQAVAAKKSPDEIRALADKSLKAFDQVAQDPNALVQANDANMSEGSVLYMIAQMDEGPSGYEKALAAFRRVHRKEDMVPIQQKRLDDLRKQAQQLARDQAAQPGAHSNASNDFSLLIDREEHRLSDLQTGPDPIIQALIGMAESYVAMKEPDEARTILHRLVAHAPLTPEQQQTVDFQILYSYVLGGQTDQADAALTDYLNKHAGDPNADSISFQIAVELMKRKDYDGALKQAERSIKDFPKGKYVADAIALQAQALAKLGRTADSAKVVDDFLKANPGSPQALNLLITRAANETTTSDFTAALADYKTVRDNPAAKPELQSAAGAGYVQTLNSLKKYDDVLAEAKTFETKYPNAKELPSVKLFAALAMNQKHDPGAIAALQDIAKKYSSDDVIAPFALNAVVSIYKQAGNTAGMVQAANDLRAAYPDSYALIANANDSVSEALLKEKKFEDAVALYEPLTKVSKTDVAAAAQNKIGEIWAAAAKALGYYQSMQKPARDEADKRLASAEQGYLATLKNFPDQLDAVGDAFAGLVNLARQRRSWGLLKDADMEGYLTMLGTDLTSPEMQARFGLAKAGLVFVTRDGARQLPAALDRFRKVMAANPDLLLTRQETNQYGELLLAAGDYPSAEKIYRDLLTNAAPTNMLAHGDADYGLGAVALAQGNLADAKRYFLALKDLNGGLWHPHINDADYGIALADENSGDPADLNSAKQIYAALMLQPQSGVALQAKAMIGYGRILEKAGYGLNPLTPGSNDNAVFYYTEPDLHNFGPTAPEASAEGLYRAGQLYQKAGDKVNAKKQYDQLLKDYATTASDWAAKARDAEATL
jgi:tetratricopeptide (TPR) repeat protein